MDVYKQIVGLIRQCKIGLVSLCLLALSPPLSAAQGKTVIIISDQQQQYQYQGIIKAIQAQLDASPTTYTVKLSTSQQYKPQDAVGHCVISIGVAPFERISRDIPGCSLSLLISRQRFNDSALAEHSSSSAIFISQSLKRIGSVLQRTFKHAEQGSIVISNTWQENLNLSQSKFDLYIKHLREGDSIIGAFRLASRDTDFVIALPDPKVYNRSNIKNILLTTYKSKVPLIGFSEALSRAGAAVSIYTPPEFLGKQAAQWLLNGQQKSRDIPQYFKVKLNKKVARSLNIKLKNQQLFEQEIWTDTDE